MDFATEEDSLVVFLSFSFGLDLSVLVHSECQHFEKKKIQERRKWDLVSRDKDLSPRETQEIFSFFFRFFFGSQKQKGG